MSLRSSFRLPPRRRSPRRFRRGLLRDTLGTTMAEYALILFAVLVVAALGIKALGYTLERKMGQAGSHLDKNGPQSGQTATDKAKAAGTVTGVASSTTGGVSDSYDGTAQPVGKAAAEQQAAQTNNFARFALVALGVLGAAAVFFAIMKGKHAGTG